MEIKIIKQPLSRAGLADIARGQFGDFVKAVVDVEQEIMAIGGELHADGEVALMEQEGSRREDTWGINLYPAREGDAFIEFDSMINLKPAFGNRSRNIEDLEIRGKVAQIAQKLIVL